MRHKHADLMIAHANNTDLEIECWEKYYNSWVEVEHPHWFEDIDYRIKPKKLKYRVAELRYISNTTTADNVEEAEAMEKWPSFIRWLSDWVEYEA